MVRQRHLGLKLVRTSRSKFHRVRIKPREECDYSPRSQTTLFEFLPPETLLYFIVLFIDIYAFIPIEFYAFNT